MWYNLCWVTRPSIARDQIFILRKTAIHLAQRKFKPSKKQIHMKAPNVQQHMTRLPLEIEQIDKVGNAKRLMELFGIRHVPVMSGIRLRGVISQSDILNATIELGRNIDHMPIEEFCEHDVLQVGPLTPVDEVAQKMLQRGVGSRRGRRWRICRWHFHVDGCTKNARQSLGKIRVKEKINPLPDAASKSNLAHLICQLEAFILPDPTGRRDDWMRRLEYGLDSPSLADFCTLP